MEANTAIRAAGNTHTITFKDQEHKNFYKQLQECSRYTVEELCCCGYAPYFWEAIKIRYPEYCY